MTGASTNLPLSHLSVEVGRLLMADLQGDAEPIRAHFEQIKPWLDATVASAVRGAERPRVSTCFLIDDYFYRSPCRPGAPAIMENLLRLAAESGVTIDYVARESACARRSDGFPTAELLSRRILEEPEPERATGARPPTAVSGWLANGRPPRETKVLTVMEGHGWEPAQEYGRRNHSVFLDVELWRDHAAPGADAEEILSNRFYSSTLLSAVWQLARLGLLRDDGAPALQTADRSKEWPAEWSDFPDITRINPDAKPFHAYRSVSILQGSFIGVEHAVQSIISHVLLDTSVVESIDVRARAERISLPPTAEERIGYVLLPGESR